MQRKSYNFKDKSAQGTPGMGMANVDYPTLKKRAQRLEKMGRCLISPFLEWLCQAKFLHRMVFNMLCACEGGTMFSKTLRKILKQYYDIDVGCYTYGPCLQPGLLPPKTKIGNYCSIAEGLKVFRRNHPFDRLSQHALFFNSDVGLVLKDTINSNENNPLTVGHDVWIGAEVIITPGCQIIGNGAVVAAGSVVSENVPPFVIVGGVPAKIIRSRFPSEVQKCIEKSQWWSRQLSELVEKMPIFLRQVDTEVAHQLNPACVAETKHNLL
jgi:acetyltransferase-like isoleucine patch superfamily enzyme